jgi:pimeloyl-ACP methyl ester carboxylesterase
MAYMTTDCGRQVYYESHGQGSSAVVLVHGWGMNVRAWDNVLPPLLEAGHRVVMLDHRCCGQSDKDFDDPGISAIAGDVVALVAQLGLDSVVLNGWSLGGAVVVEAASRLGEQCRAVVLTGGASPIYIQKPDLPLGGQPADMAATVAGLKADRIAFLHGLSQAVCAKEVPPPVVEWIWQVFCQASPRAIETIAQLEPLDQRDMLAGLPCPVLSFVGSQDAFVDPAIGRWVGDNHPRATVVEFEGVGHAPFIEVTDDYNRELLQFLATHS